MPEHATAMWTTVNIASPTLAHSIKCVAALDIPYKANAHRFQTLNIYVPATDENIKLVGDPVHSIPLASPISQIPRIMVYIHGGAWRAYNLTSRSIEPTAAHAFSHKNSAVQAIVAINYTLSPSAANSVVEIGYDPIRDGHSDPSREALHPMHIADVLHAFGFLRALGLLDDSYILCGHSCGACICFQALLQHPSYWGLDQPSPPRPAAVVTFNGLYDLTQLVHGLGPKHQHLRDDYYMLISKAFGSDEVAWESFSPARFDVEHVALHVKRGKAPKLVLLDASKDDQLAPTNGTERMMIQLSLVEGIKVVRGTRSQGPHAEIWEHGQNFWKAVQDILDVLRH